MTTSKALIVEDDADLRSMVALAARCCGLEPISAATLADALSLLQRESCAAVLADLNLPPPGLFRNATSCESVEIRSGGRPVSRKRSCAPMAGQAVPLASSVSGSR